MMCDWAQRATNLKYHISSQYNLHCSHSTHITTCRSPWWPPPLSCSAPWSDALLLLVNPTTLCKWYPILLLPWLSKHYPRNIQHILLPRLSKKHFNLECFLDSPRAVCHNLTYPRISTNNPSDIWHNITPQVYLGLSAITTLIVPSTYSMKTFYKCIDLCKTQHTTSIKVTYSVISWYVIRSFVRGYMICDGSFATWNMRVRLHLKVTSN